MERPSPRSVHAPGRPGAGGRCLSLRSRSVGFCIIPFRKYHCFSPLFFCTWRLTAGSSLLEACTRTVTPNAALGATEERSSESGESALPEGRRKRGGGPGPGTHGRSVRACTEGHLGSCVRPSSKKEPALL